MGYTNAGPGAPGPPGADGAGGGGVGVLSPLYLPEDWVPFYVPPPNLGPGPNEAAEGDHVHPGGGASGSWIRKSKAADEAILSDTTLSRDDTLFFTMLASGLYAFRMVAFVAGSGTADFKYRFLLSTGGITTVRFKRTSKAPASASASEFVNEAMSVADHTFAWAGAGETRDGYIFIDGEVQNDAVEKDFEFHWAQNALDGAVATTVLKHSYIDYLKI